MASTAQSLVVSSTEERRFTLNIAFVERAGRYVKALHLPQAFAGVERPTIKGRDAFNSDSP